MLAGLWWITFTICGIWGQVLVPGVDFFAPGMAVSLRWQKPYVTVILAVVWVAVWAAAWVAGAWGGVGGRWFVI